MKYAKEFVRGSRSSKLLSQNFLERLRNPLPRLRFEPHIPNYKSGDLLQCNILIRSNKK